MHMADALISPAVGGVMWGVSSGAAAYSVKKIKEIDLEEKKVPLMGVMGAFVFAAQMINFAIPGTGSSGHIGGGILLAAILGPFPAFLTLSIVLLIQALFFADGGLLALGCNIINLGVIPCFLVYPLVFLPIVRKNHSKLRIAIASVLAVVIGLQLGAFSVVLQTLASRVTALPFREFLLLMQPIHLAIGVIEGIITAAVLVFIHQTQPEIMQKVAVEQRKSPVSLKVIMMVFLILTVFTGGYLSLRASGDPDGLEWAIERVAGVPELESAGNAHQRSAGLQDSLAFLPDYDYPEETGASRINGTTFSGLVGSLIVFLTAGISGFIISRVKRARQEQ